MQLNFWRKRQIQRHFISAIPILLRQENLIVVHQKNTSQLHVRENSDGPLISAISLDGTIEFNHWCDQNNQNVIGISVDAAMDMANALVKPERERISFDNGSTDTYITLAKYEGYRLMFRKMRAPLHGYAFLIWEKGKIASYSDLYHLYSEARGHFINQVTRHTIEPSLEEIRALLTAIDSYLLSDMEYRPYIIETLTSIKDYLSRLEVRGDNKYISFALDLRDGDILKEIERENAAEEKKIQ